MYFDSFEEDALVISLFIIFLSGLAAYLSG